jgi:uncharacterized protein YpiB (UPF0302 family)
LKRLRKEYKLVTNDHHKYYAFKLTQEEEFALHLQATLFLDEQCFLFNKSNLNKRINDALLHHDVENFKELSKLYSNYIET